MTPKSILHWLADQPPELFAFRHGLEKEGLRTNQFGQISQSEHPAVLGSALTHPSITTDYSEALLEFITPVVETPQQSLQHLEQLHKFVYASGVEDDIWPASMPAVLKGEKSVRIAEYGSSHIGRLKNIYRHGLWHRYGRIMQVIAGLHFNFSVPDAFWPAFQSFSGASAEPESRFRSRMYFGLIRHFRRHSWVLLYLFGASPAVDRSFLRSGSARLTALGDQTLYSPTATSLRMSDIGYTNAAQQSLKVCFNSMPTYVDTLRQALHTPYPPYQSIGLKKGDEYQQLNANVLQIENEYYSDIRPKRTTERGEKPLAALERRGVEYIEVRCLDLNPFLPLGIDADQIRFLNWFLFWCLTADAPPLGDVECERVDFNQRLAVLYGRDPELRLVDQSTVRQPAEWGDRILDEMTELVEAVGPADKAEVLSAIERYRGWFHHPEQTPSGRLCSALTEGRQEFHGFIRDLAAEHRSSLMATPLSAETFETLNRLAQDSRREQVAMEARSTGSFEEFLAAFMAQ